MADLSTAATVLGTGIAAIAAWYAYVPYRAARRARSSARFVEVRKLVSRDRFRLSGLALEYYRGEFQDDRLPGMLSCDRFIPPRPIRLDCVEVQILGQAENDVKLVAAARRILPREPSGKRFDRFSTAISTLAPPGLWFDALCYSIEDVRFLNDSALLVVRTKSFFAGVDIAEALAHELARGPRRTARSFALRKRVRDPLDLHARSSLAAVSALVLRDEGGSVTFFLHDRDPEKVAVAGGQIHLAPSGIFQPTSGAPEVIQRDRSPALTLCRELAEEYLGTEEARGDDGAALSYDDDEPYGSILPTLVGSDARAYFMGVGLDPLTLCPELLCVVAIESSVFDSLFADLKIDDDEGRLRGARRLGGRLVGFTFSRESLDSLLSSGRLSPGARAALEHAWRHRDEILSGGL